VSYVESAIEAAEESEEFAPGSPGSIVGTVLLDFGADGGALGE
jgi:hypothetical protein